MLSKSRTNSEAHEIYCGIYSTLRTWQRKERTTSPTDQEYRDFWRSIWQRNQKFFPALTAHLTEAFFWADHEAGKHAEQSKQEQAARFASNRFNWKA